MNFDFLKLAEMLEKAFGRRFGPIVWRLIVVVAVLGFFGTALVGGVHGYKVLRADLATGLAINPLVPSPTEQPRDQTAAIAARPLPPAEADRKIKAIDQLLDVIGPAMEPTIAEGFRLKSGAWNAFADPKNSPNYDKDLDNYVTVTKANEEKLASLRDQRSEYPDLAASLSDIYRLYGAAANFRQGYQLLATYLSKNIDNNHFEFLLKPYAEPFNTAILGFRDWRNNAHASMVRLRQATAQ